MNPTFVFPYYFGHGWRLEPAGDRAMIIRVPGKPGPDAAAQILALQNRLDEMNLPGIEETVPGFTTLLVCYNPLVLRYERLAAELAANVVAGESGFHPTGRLVTVPVLYGGNFGPDLERVAAQKGLSLEGVVAAHTGQEYMVYFLGFTPGFAYMGELPEVLAVPRHERPRLAVPAGSVGLAGRQTGIYPAESPGGWQIIGRTPLAVYDPDREPRGLFQPGDRVRFCAIDAETFAVMAASKGG